jgi:hypothetical protein
MSNADPGLQIGVFTVCNLVYALFEWDSIVLLTKKRHALSDGARNHQPQERFVHRSFILLFWGVEALSLVVYMASFYYRGPRWVSGLEIASSTVLSCIPGVMQLVLQFCINRLEKKIPLYRVVYDEGCLKLFSKREDYERDKDKDLLPESVQTGEMYEFLEDVAFGRHKKVLEELLRSVPNLFDRVVINREKLAIETEKVEIDRRCEMQLKELAVIQCVEGILSQYFSDVMPVKKGEIVEYLKDLFQKIFEESFPSNRYDRIRKGIKR